MFRFFGLFLSLFAFWLILSGMYTPFLVASGFACALAVTLLVQRMYLFDHQVHPVRLVWSALLSYWPWLVWEMIKSGWDVTRRILHPALPISPTLAAFTPSQTSDIGLVIHANSITLTPGTIAIEVGPQRFLVHALTQSGAAGLAASEMDRRCVEMERC